MTEEVDLYARLSKAPDGSVLGVERQIDEVTRELVEPRGWTIRHIFIDNDLSATSGVERPAFEELLAVQPKRSIAVWHMDRIVRLTRDLERVIDLGVNIYALKAGHLDLSTPSGRAVARTITAWSTYEGEIRNERQRTQQRQRAQQGRRWWSTRPVGYELDGTPREAEAKHIRQGYAELLDGVSLAGVARAWNAAGFVTPGGKPWTTQRASQTLRAHRYAGLLTHRGEEVGRGDWEPIVDELTWRSAYRLLTDPGRYNGGGSQYRTLAAGFIKCGVCEGSMRATRWKQQPIYECVGAKCVRAGRAWLDEVIGEYVILRLEDEDAAELWRDDSATGAVPDLREEVLRLRERLDGLAEDYAEGLVSREQLRSGSVRLRERLEEAEGALAQAHAATPLSGLLAAPDARSEWASMDLDVRRAVLSALLERITLNRRPPGRRKHQVEDVVVEWRTPEDPHPDQG